MQKQSLYPIRKKLLIIIISIAFFFVTVIGRVGYLQLVGGEALQVKAMDQWMRDLPLSPKRGTIYDVDGVVLADSTTLYTIYVRPNAVKNVESTALVLSNILDVDNEKLLQKISKKVSEVTISKKVSRDKMLKIIDSNLSGVYVSEDNYRYYPYGQFMTQVLGYTNIDGNGQEGVEKYYDEYLYGQKGYVMTETDLIGDELMNSATVFVPAVDGLDIRLTLDFEIQKFAESVVSDAIITHHATSASVIVMNTKTGAILAMANAPSFDLNHVPRNDLLVLYEGSKNRLVNSVFEPGSTFKILTLSAAIEESKYDIGSSFYCPGYRIVDGQRIKCWKTQGHGSENLSEGVKNSCNCVFMDMALSLGIEKTYQYTRSFGLNQKTGIDSFGETGSIMISEDSVKNVDLARIGFGQAIAVTPLQLITACSAAVNGGKLMTPYICDSITDDRGKVYYKRVPAIRNTVISESTSRTVSNLLEVVVSEGSGKGAYVSGYRIGGKTGTAQKYKNGAISHGNYVSSFIGFAPADAPEYSVLVIVDEPKTMGYYGSIVAAPYAGQIFSNIFSYYNVPKSYEEEIDYFVMPDLVGKTYSEAVSIMRYLGLEYEIEGNIGNIVYQMPVAGATVSKYNIALIRTDVQE